MPWRGPEYEGEFPSLGWALVDLIEDYYRVPSGLQYGRPFKLTDAQTAFMVRLHRIDPRTGRYVFRKGVKEGPKGEGKSPMGGAFAFAHLVGPVIFDGWDADGEPVGRPHPTPWIQIAALAEDQTDNLYAQLHAGLADSPAIEDFGIDLGITRVYLKDRPGRIEPVTSAGGTREGQPITAAVKEETQYWTPNRGGDRLNATLDRNLGKTNGLSLSVTNTYRMGEESVAEADARSAAKGARGLLYEATRGPVIEDLTDRKAVLEGLRVAYDPQSLTDRGGWVDPERLADECADPGVRPQDARRFYFNIPDETTDDSWIHRDEWKLCCRPGDVIPDGADVYLGVDVALYRDNTAVAVVWRDPETGRFVVRVKTWDPKASGEVDVTDVMAHIRALSFQYRIVEAVFDPRFFDVPAKMLADEGIPMLELAQNPTFMVPACGFAYEQIRGGMVSHDGDPILEAHVLGAAMRQGESGWTLSKNKSRHVIDACIAMVMPMYRCGQPQKAPPTFFGAWA